MVKRKHFRIIKVTEYDSVDNKETIHFEVQERIFFFIWDAPDRHMFPNLVSLCQRQQTLRKFTTQQEAEDAITHALKYQAYPLHEVVA